MVVVVVVVTAAGEIIRMILIGETLLLISTNKVRVPHDWVS